MAIEKASLEQKLDSLYRSRQILVERVDKKSAQIKNTYTRGILFLVAFSALIFFRDFKPSSWDAASDSFSQWEKRYDKGLLGGVNYRDFLNSQDSITRLNRYRILLAMDTSASDDSPVLTYYQQPKQGIILDSLPQIAKQIDNLLAYQKEMVKDSSELVKFKADSAKARKSFANTPLTGDPLLDLPANQAIIRELEAIGTEADGIRLDLRVKDSLSKAILKKLFRDYPPIEVWGDPKKTIGEQIKLIEEEFNEFRNDERVTPWLAIDKKSSAWQWKLKTWKLLNVKIDPAKKGAKKDTTQKGSILQDTVKVVHDWEVIFKSLKADDIAKIKKEIIKPDSLFDYNKKELKKYIAAQKSKQDKLKVPTAQISSTKIPLPLKHILLVLPLIYAGMLLIIQLLHLKRSTYEIRTAFVEEHIEDYTEEEFARSSLYGEEILVGKKDWDYLKKADFAGWFRNNPTYYKDAFFVAVSGLFFAYLMFKWGTMLRHNPNLLGWGLGIAFFSLILYVSLYLINQKISREVLAKERREYEESEKEKMEERFSIDGGGPKGGKDTGSSSGIIT